MTEIIKVNPNHPERELLDKAVQVIIKGGMIAFPTDTFYGLGVDIFNERAIRRVFEVKKRDYNKPLMVLIKDRQQVCEIAEEISELAVKLMDKFWPGPLTMLFKASSKLSVLLTGNTGKIGVRVPGNKVALELLKNLPVPITGTSANLTGRPELSSASEVEKVFAGQIEMIVNGGSCPGGGASTIIDTTEASLKIIREGIISIDKIKESLSN